MLVLAFRNEEDRSLFTKYYTPTIGIKDYNVLIDLQPFYDIPIKNKEQTYKAITELFNHDNYTTGNYLTCDYFCNHYKLIAIDLSKQNSDFKNQQINFVGQLEQNATIELVNIRNKFRTKSINYCIKMESQKFKNLLDHKEDTYKKCQTKKWYVINDRNNGQYGERNTNDDPIKIDTEVVKPFLCDYADAYILVAGNITALGVYVNTKVAFKNCHPFIKCKIHSNDEHVEDSDNLDLIMNMYNLIEYSDNYEDSTPSLNHFKRQEPLADNANLSDDSSSFKYKSNLLGYPSNSTVNNNVTALSDNTNPEWKNARTIVPLKYISSFFRSLELPLINTKLNIQLNYTKYSVISTVDAANSITFEITKTELCVPVVTLKTEDNNKLNELLDGEFKRKLYWNEYKSKIETIAQDYNEINYKKTLLDAAIPGVNRLFEAAFPNAPVRRSHRQYFLPSLNINDYNILIDGRNFYDQNISDDFKKYEELRKVMTGRGEDYTTGSLLDYDYWKNNYKSICCDLSKQKVLGSNPKGNQQIEFVYKLDNNTQNSEVLTVLEKEKETNLEFRKETVKVY